MPLAAAANPCAADISVLRDANINLRLSVQVKNLIDAAASAVGQTRTEFMISTARKHAIDVLLDRTFFHLEGENAEKFAEQERQSSWVLLHRCGRSIA